MDYVEKEVLEAIQHTRAGRDFLMTGGAGSGKTHSMEGFLKQIYAENPHVSVACVTYTNVAVNEIRSRFPHPNLHVATIHEFLWALISRYQKNIRQGLAELVNEGTIANDLKAPVDADFWQDGILYREWLDLQAGHISHAEVLLITRLLFTEHPLLAKILGDRYDYLLVDEYQDTPVDVLKILLELLPEPERRSLRVGFFGDGEQAIHEGGKSKAVVESAVESGRIELITKSVNRRNPAAVIRLIQHLRTDGLDQVQSKDSTAPNFGKEGSARFIYTVENELDIAGLKKLSICCGWDYSSQITKFLYLGKSAIARENKFPQLMDIYSKDRAVEYAKKLRNALSEEGISVDSESNFGDVIDAYQGVCPMTPVIRKAFDSRPELLSYASKFSFQDLATTSTNSDKLLGTKKTSDFDERDRGEKRDELINHLMAIQELRDLFRRGRFNAVIRSMDVHLTSIDDRRRVASSLNALESLESAPIEDVIDYAHRSGLVVCKDAVRVFQKRHPYRYARVGKVPFDEIASLYDYVEDYSPFSTQHGVKGSEWDNVFVSLETGGWNLYNFQKLFASPRSDGSVESRSRMMLYVTCSRAKENLVVYVHRPGADMLRQAAEWFGAENVLPVG